VIGISVDDPDATFSEIATSAAVRNWSGVKDPTLDALFERQSQTLDFSERRPLVQELERRALAGYGMAVLYFQDAAFAKLARVRDYVFHGSQTTNRRMESVWLSP
jgi:ABC-type oligopeptide transport system substrate-binding subunit